MFISDRDTPSSSLVRVNRSVQSGGDASWKFFLSCLKSFTREFAITAHGVIVIRSQLIDSVGKRDCGGFEFRHFV